MKRILSIAVASIIAVSTLVAAEVKKDLVLASEVNWTHLNPKRGDLAPSAGTLWGDRNGTEATGYLLKTNEGFQSPPHIHNVSYRAIVIRGFIHNDDTNAAKMWMPAGSYWTQPKGEVHITASKGKNALAYIEIEEGPYLVHPEEEAFDSGERPVNIDKSNIVWLDADDVKWIDQSNTKNGVQVSFLWGESKEGILNGSFIKLPAGFKGKINSKGSDFKAIVVKGQPNYKSDKQGNKTLELGSYFSSKGAASTHEISSKNDEETLLYVRSKGTYSVIAD